MSVEFQANLFDVAPAPEVGSLAPTRRTPLPASVVEQPAPRHPPVAAQPAPRHPPVAAQPAPRHPPVVEQRGTSARRDHTPHPTNEPAAWVDVRPNWIAGADEVFASLIQDVPWRAERREMWDQVVDVPRLLHTYAAGETLPHPLLAEARDVLSAHYLPELEEPFVTAGCCYYRDGRDSVAWHGDTIGRGRHEDTMVAILSFGDPRRLALRPRGGGESISFTMGHGDLLVMGGSCQRTWEHCVPKTAQAGPRISVQFRPLNVF